MSMNFRKQLIGENVVAGITAKSVNVQFNGSQKGSVASVPIPDPIQAQLLTIKSP